MYRDIEGGGVFFPFLAGLDFDALRALKPYLDGYLNWYCDSYSVM